MSALVSALFWLAAGLLGVSVVLLGGTLIVLGLEAVIRETHGDA